ncbi:hypothetical protein GCM10010399_43550 [Dactylosporangium fulvum]|uniref:Uncharacterized protein n=1 Tax=Dactylosporangium fulvum TaxID=53359 RepID=A0ABY5W8U4_9ACTN|nr:hypothetical protein [Dactylosporangium fulvum]UWP85977.1 hypothetical protein Dfulv_17665 [Dactylosporangium fulvum]
MTTTLRTALADLAEQSRLPGDPGNLWRRGRRLRRRRRLTTAAAGAVLMALAVLVALPPVWPGAPGPAQVAAGGAAVLPSRFGAARPWQELAERSPNGPAMLVFTNVPSRLSLLPGGPVTVIGQDGSYRAMATSPVPPQRLSPDGKLLARWDGIVDLTSGRRVPISGYGEAAAQVLDWSPGGTEVLMGVEDRIVVVDAATGRVRTVLTVATDQAVDDSFGVFSPDGSRIALVLGAQTEPRRVTVVDTAGGTVRAELQLTGRQRLAGWDADGVNLVLVAAEVCDWTLCARNAPDIEHARAALERQRWHLQFADPATGSVVDEPRTGRTGWPNRLVGWHGQDAVWIVGDYPADHVSIEAVRPGEPARVLAVSDDPVADLDVARDLVSQGRFGGPAIDAPLWPPRAEARRALGVGAIALIALLLFVRGLIVMARRRWPPAQPTSPVRDQPPSGR